MIKGRCVHENTSPSLWPTFVTVAEGGKQAGQVLCYINCSSCYWLINDLMVVKEPEQLVFRHTVELSLALIEQCSHHDANSVYRQLLAAYSFDFTKGRIKADMSKSIREFHVNTRALLGSC